MIKADIDEVKRLNLKRLMKERNMGPKILADMVDVSQSYISALLKGGKVNGGRNLGKQTVLKICKVFDVEEYEFYKLEVIGKTIKSNEMQEYTTERIQNLKDLAVVNKKLNERLEQENERLEQENEKLKRKVKNLTEEFQKLIKKYTEYRRRGDPEDLDVAALRKYPKEEI